MQLFGGDPRYVHFKILLDMNRWYFILIACIFVILFALRSHDATYLFIFLLFALVEIFRIFLTRSFITGEVPMYTASIVLTVIPQLVVDFLWLFFVRTRNGFDYAAIAGMIMFHVAEVAVFGVPQLLRLTRYQQSFFRFHAGYRQAPVEIELNDLSS
jgi:hypothetical protein